MIQMDVKICTVDQTPIEFSDYYKTLVEEIGEEKAEKWTEIVSVPKDDS